MIPVTTMGTNSVGTVIIAGPRGSGRTTRLLRWMTTWSRAWRGVRITSVPSVRFPRRTSHS